MSELEQVLQQVGMLVLGQTKTDVGTITLVGNAGSDMWRAFCKSRSSDELLMDDWTKSVLDPIASHFGLQARYPYDLPYPPILTWAQQAGVGTPSPLGLLVHPVYGLWHAYRAAFVGAVEVSPTEIRPSPCLTCADKPCLNACPVGAFSDAGYDVDLCRGHVSTSDRANCMALACNARRNCPIGTDYVYAPDHARFHMRAFAGPQEESQ